MSHRRLTVEEARRRIWQAQAKHFRARARVGMEEWCRDRLKLERNQSVEHAGKPYDIRKTPHVKIIEDFLNDPVAKELNLMKSSASGFTTFTLACIIRILEEDPRNVLYMIGNITEAERVVKKDFQPFARQVFGSSVVDGKGQKISHMRLNGVEIWFGSPTEDQLRNKQVAIIVEDESDTMEDRLAGGGQDLEIAQKERTKGYTRSKIIRLCTPIYRYDPSKRKEIVQPRTRIHRNYLRGDQREYHCPCPGCGEMQPVRLHDLQYEHYKKPSGDYDFDRIREETYWKCPKCAQIVREGPEKERMVRAGRWLPTAEPINKTVWSARQTDLIALIGQATWGYIAEQVVLGKKEGKLAAVLRSHLAEPEDPTGSQLERSKEALLKHCGDYERGTVPIVPWVMAIAADVQDKGKYFPWVKGALTIFGDLYIVDWGEAESTEELERERLEFMPILAPEDQLAINPVTGERLRNVRCGQGVIDTGHAAREDEDDPTRESVYRFCLSTMSARSKMFTWIPMKGRGGKQIGNNMTKDEWGHVNSDIKIPLCGFNDWAFKTQLYNERLSDPDNPGHLKKSLPIIRLPRYHEAMMEDNRFTTRKRYVSYDDFCEQMLAERVMLVNVKKKNGLVEQVRRWTVPTGMRNDFGDCVKMLSVLHYFLSRRSTDAAGAA